MRRVPIFQIDAFAARRFAGNPAAVCPVDDWLDDAVLQAIAAENNLAETAFLRRAGDDYDLRWFTPRVEVDLCGHATLASAYVVFHYLEPGRERVTFHTLSGALTVTRSGDLLTLDFPVREATPCDPRPVLGQALGTVPEEVRLSWAYLVVLESEAHVRAVKPDMERLRANVDRCVIVTAPGTDCDFVSRFFAPAMGIPEDPVTGSAHCTLVPYWAERLGKPRLHARQVSERGGELFCELQSERVLIAGRAVPYLEGEILLEQP
jgi:PhzF family phenazine biosynthesis protein